MVSWVWLVLVESRLTSRFLKSVLSTGKQCHNEYPHLENVFKNCKQELQRSMTATTENVFLQTFWTNKTLNMYNYTHFTRKIKGCICQIISSNLLTFVWSYWHKSDSTNQQLLFLHKHTQDCSQKILQKMLMILFKQGDLKSKLEGVDIPGVAKSCHLFEWRRLRRLLLPLLGFSGCTQSPSPEHNLSVQQCPPSETPANKTTAALKHVISSLHLLLLIRSGNDLPKQRWQNFLLNFLQFCRENPKTPPGWLRDKVSWLLSMWRSRSSTLSSSPYLQRST